MKIIGSMEKDAHESTLNTILIVLLFALACMFFPTHYLESYLGKFYSGVLIRFIFSGVGMLFICFYSFHSLFKFKKQTKASILVFIAALAVAVNNFPILPFIYGNAEFSAEHQEIFAYSIFCLSIGLFEEIFFRGIILPLFIIRFKNKKHGNLLAIFVSSAVFGLVHIINLFGGSGIGAVALQIGYSTLIGAMCAVVMIFAKNIWFPVILHSVYNFGGLLLSYDMIGLKGSLWTVSSVLLTVITAILVTVIICFIFLRRYKTALNATNFAINENIK